MRQPSERAIKIRPVELIGGALIIADMVFAGCMAVNTHDETLKSPSSLDADYIAESKYFLKPAWSSFEDNKTNLKLSWRAGKIAVNQMRK